MKIEVVVLLILLAVSAVFLKRINRRIHSRVQVVRRYWTTVITDEAFLKNEALQDVPQAYALNRKREIEDLFGLKDLQVLSPEMTLGEIIGTLNKIHRVNCSISDFPYLTSFTKLLCDNHREETIQAQLLILKNLTVGEFIALCFVTVPQMK